MNDKQTAWYWLNAEERNVLLDFNPNAKKIVNAEFKMGDLTHTERRVIGQSGRAWLPEKHIIVRERSNELVTVYHPTNPDYTKMEYRACAVFLERSTYIGDTWPNMVRACMQPPLLTVLRWDIYAVSNGTPHIYLKCALPGVDKATTVVLYVPTSYFKFKDYSVVEKYHEDVAVGYYLNGNFGVAAHNKVEWAERTRAALTCMEAKVLRAIVENKL